MANYQIEVEGDIREDVSVGDDIDIINSQVNDGTYTVDDITYDGNTFLILEDETLNPDDNTGDVRFNVGGEGEEPFASHPNEYGDYTDGSYEWTQPEEGDVVYSKEDDGIFVYDGHSWCQITDSKIKNTIDIYHDFTDPSELNGWSKGSNEWGYAPRITSSLPIGTGTGGWINAEADASETGVDAYSYMSLNVEIPMSNHFVFTTRFLVDGTTHDIQIGFSDTYLSIHNLAGDVKFGEAGIGLSMNISENEVHTFQLQTFWNERTLGIWLDGELQVSVTIPDEYWYAIDDPYVRVETTSTAAQDLYVDYLYYYADNRGIVIGEGGPS